MAAPIPEPNALLSGVKVLDLTRVLSGPFCTQILADMGADVWKIEALEGDSTRRIAPYYEGGESHYFMSLNRNKRSAVADFKSEAGKAFILGLAAECDVVVENFRPGVLKRLGLGFDELATANPSLILCSISGFGQDGPLRDTPAFDLVTQARSGAMSVQGEADGPPSKLAVPMGDVGAGFWAAISVLGALHRRASDPSPQHLDISMLDGLIATQGYLNQLTLLTGVAPARVGSDHHSVAPYGRFEAKDGYLILAILIDRFWEVLCNALEMPELVRDERFETNAARAAHKHELRDLIEPVLRLHPRAYWVEVLTAADVPHAPLLDVREALDQDQVDARGLIRHMSHTTAGDVTVVGSPIKVNGQSISPTPSAPPILGEHTGEIARDVLGWDEERIVSLLDIGGAVTGARS